MIEEINILSQKLSENLSMILDLKNSVKTKEIEKQDMMKDFFRDIIDTIDSFDNKEKSLLSKNKENEEYIKLIISFSSIRKKLINILSKHGVTQIEFPEHRLIVGFSKVIETEPDPSKKNDTIISIVRNGYIRGHEVIREAELIIVKN